ncbi:MAG: amidohydrolase family protein [Pseudomonadota bacterium]
MRTDLNRLMVLVLAAIAVPAAADDILIVNGLVFEGSLRPPRVANIAIRDGRITSVDAGPDATAERVIDADGQWVLPGFIDPHTHASLDLVASAPARRRNLNYLAQGVTTVFVGNDGGGSEDVPGYLGKLEAAGVGTNVAALAGHGAIRRRVMGLEVRAPTRAEQRAMETVLAEALDAGAFGLSLGLFYAPGSYAQTEEIIALARVVGDRAGVVDSHMRSESSAGVGVLGALQEMILIAETADVAVHVSHIKALGGDVTGYGETMIQMINDARARGLDITANQYPWLASGTRLSNALLERWVQADSKDAMRARLRNPALRQRVFEEMAANLVVRNGADAFLITKAGHRFAGQTLADAAARLELPTLEAAVEIILDGDPSVASFVMAREDVDAFAVQPWVMTGSDGSSGHPRKYGTYPKKFADFVRDRRLLSPEEFVHRSAGLVAETIGLCERGFLRTGYHADVAVLDPDAFAAIASYEDATALSAGIHTVLVGGRVAYAAGEEETPGLRGQVLRSTDCAAEPRP